MMSGYCQPALLSVRTRARSSVRSRLMFPEAVFYVLIVWLSVEGFLTNRYGSLLYFAIRESVVLLLYLALLRGIVRYWQPSFGRALRRVLIVFGVIYAVQVFNPAVPNILVGMVGVRDNLWYVPLFVVGYIVFGDEVRLARLLCVVAAVYALGAVASLVQFAGGESRLLAFGPGYSRAIIYTGTGRSFLRVSGLAASPGLAGAAFFAGCVCAVAGALLAGSRKQRVIMVAAGPLCFCALLVSGSRTWFAFLLIWLALLWAIGRGSRVWLTAIVLLTVGVFFVAGHRLHVGISDRYATIASGQTVWSRFYGLFVYRLLQDVPEAVWGLGAGVASAGSRHFLGGRGVVPLVESDFIRIACEVGIPGLICFGLIFLLLMRRTWQGLARSRTLRSRMYIAGVLSLQIGAVIVMLVGTPMLVQPFPQLFWLLSGAACAMVPGAAPMTTMRRGADAKRIGRIPRPGTP